MTYCIDTSALMDAWVRWYPTDCFPSLWQKLDNLANSNELIASEEVLKELERKNDTLYRWAKERKHIFKPLDEDVQNAVIKIMTEFPRLVDSRKNRSGADPFVIATSMVYKKILITGEKSSGNLNRPRIPNVCEHYKVEYMGIVKVIQKKNGVFKKLRA